MTQIGNNPDIRAVGQQLSYLKEKGLIAEWELPYENILTRLTAAIFFLTPADAAVTDEIWAALEVFPQFRYRANEDKRLSRLQYRVEFNQELENR